MIIDTTKPIVIIESALSEWADQGRMQRAKDNIAKYFRGGGDREVKHITNLFKIGEEEIVDILSGKYGLIFLADKVGGIPTKTLLVELLGKQCPTPIVNRSEVGDMSKEFGLHLLPKEDFRKRRSNDTTGEALKTILFQEALGELATQWEKYLTLCQEKIAQVLQQRGKEEVKLSQQDGGNTDGLFFRLLLRLKNLMGVGSRE